MVTPALAKLLIKKGIGKQVSKGTGQPISKVGDLPPAAQKMFKSPKAVADQKLSIKSAGEIAKKRLVSARKAATTRAAKPKTPRVKSEDPTTLKGRTNKARRQAAEAAPKSKSKTSSVPTKTRRGVLEQLKIDRELAFQAAQKLRGAEQARGSVRIVPRSQKGMSLPGKGGTVKRSRGGPVNARSRAAIRGFRKEQRGG